MNLNRNELLRHGHSFRIRERILKWIEGSRLLSFVAVLGIVEVFQTKFNLFEFTLWARVLLLFMLLLVLFNDVEGETRRLHEKVILVVLVAICIFLFAIVNDENVIIIVILVPQFERFLNIFGILYLLNDLVKIELLLLRLSLVFDFFKWLINSIFEAELHVVFIISFEIIASASLFFLLFLLLIKFLSLLCLELRLIKQVYNVLYILKYRQVITFRCRLALFLVCHVCRIRESRIKLYILIVFFTNEWR